MDKIENVNFSRFMLFRKHFYIPWYVSCPDGCGSEIGRGGWIQVTNSLSSTSRTPPSPHPSWISDRSNIDFRKTSPQRMMHSAATLFSFRRQLDRWPALHSLWCDEHNFIGWLVAPVVTSSRNVRTSSARPTCGCCSMLLCAFKACSPNLKLAERYRCAFKLIDEMCPRLC